MLAARFERADTSRLPSDTIWGRCPWTAINNGLVPGFTFFDDFMSYPITPPTTEGNWGSYAMFSSTGGTAANPSTPQGGGELDIGSDGDNEGVGLRTLAVPFKINQSTEDFWFEGRIRTSTIADTKHNIFLGLMTDNALTAISPLTALGALADVGLCGFQRPESARTVAGTGGAIANTVYKASGVTAVTVQSDAVALVAATYTKLGIRYQKRGDKDGDFALTFYQDGTRLSTSKLIPSGAGTDFPNNVFMGLVFAVLNATASSPGTTCLDWWRAAQVVVP